MARVAPAQVSFNGGEISQRLQARIDQSLYAISVAEMIGFAPLVEGPAEAMPGTIHVATMPGACRLVRFEYSTTQGHALAFGDGWVRIFTNDTLLTTIASPYSWAQAQALTFHQSYDVLYCFHPDLPPRKFTRTAAAAFAFELVEFTDGPFDRRNSDKGFTVSASGVDGDVVLQASADLFAPGDVGGLFRIEAEDFGDITAWEPYTTVTQGQYLTANDRVYRVVGGNPDSTGRIRTGTLTPVHTEGVEWDGIAKGLDVNDKPAGGVRLEYMHDRWGVLRITGYTSATQVAAAVLRRLPFSGTTPGSYAYPGGYYAPGYEDYVPPETDAAYFYGTYRWSFGAFSDRRGYPAAGAIWSERLWLAAQSTLYASVAGDLDSHAERNEAGEVSDDMAIIAVVQDANPILHVVPDENLLALTASGVHVLSAASAAKGVAPGNVRARKQPSSGASDGAAPVELDGRTIFIDRSRSRIYETDLDPGRQVEQPVDLARYARHIGRIGLREIAAQPQPFNHLWAVLADGALACAAYLPEEQVLGFARRVLAPGLAARSLCTITDPAGCFDQLWIAAEFAGAWHVLRMAPWRQDGESDPNACMLDMAAGYEGSSRADFTHAALPNRTVQVIADGAFLEARTNGSGQFTLEEAASTVWAGLAYPASIETLDLEMGGDNGPAIGRKAKIGRGWIKVIDARGLRFGTPGDLIDLELLRDGSSTDEGFAPETGFRLRESMGDHTRHPRIRVERVAPFQATIAAFGATLNMERH